MKLTLLVRQDCHLCSVAERALYDLGLTFDKVDVDSDASLRQQYGDFIPVLLSEGREIARAPLNRDVLRDALRRVKLD